MVTIKDIAATLQVSPSTVGRALADDRRISAEMKRKVNEAATQAGYIANRAARMMRGVQSNLVGLIVPDIRNSFYSTIAHGCTEHHSLGARRQGHRERLEQFQQKGVAVLRPDLRENKEIEHFRDSEKNGNALGSLL